MDEHEYVVVSRRFIGRDDPKVSGPYSQRQAHEVASNTLGLSEVVRIVRPTYWLAEDDDLARYQPERTG